MRSITYIKFRYISIILIISISWISTSCRKVIDLDLNSSNPEIVIEGSVSNSAGPHMVELTKTINFDESNNFPPVSGAVVRISDNVGNSDVLTEGPLGVYKTTSLAGVPGRNYLLEINVAGKMYQSTSYMYTPVAIDEVAVDSFTFGPNANKYVNVKFKDPAGVKNFYRIIEIINGDTLDIINVGSDRFSDGLEIVFPVFSDEDPELKSGDEVEILLMSIDESVYNYLSELSEVLNGGGQSAAPANPTSNISNNALGYFSAHSISTSTIIVE
jgi:hypothetical protein